MAMETETTRPAPPDRRPDLSVIVPSVNGLEILLECLDALLLNAEDGLALEVLVIERCGDAVRQALAARVPGVVVHPVPHDMTIPQMRALGFRHATADAVAVIEDHILVPPNWARQLLHALASGSDVVGGSIANAATSTAVDRAAFLCEYSHLLAPRAGSAATELPGNNVVYRRAILERYAQLLEEGRWEDHLHSAMRRDGVALYSRPGIVVGHKMHYRMADYVTQRFLYSRAYAGIRRTTMPPIQRALFALGSFALPPVLLTRIIVRVAASRRHRAELLSSLPLLVVFVSAWAAGEFVGYIGGAGDAMAKVR